MSDEIDEITNRSGPRSTLEVIGRHDPEPAVVLILRFNHLFVPLPVGFRALLSGLGVGDYRGHDGVGAARETRAMVFRHWHTDWHTKGPKSTAEPGNRTRTRVTPQRFLRPPRLPFRQPGPPILWVSSDLGFQGWP
jgi:hypothetical protein